MRKFLIVAFLFLSAGTRAQNSRSDSILAAISDYEAFFSELEHFIDSITEPRSFVMLHSGFSAGHFYYYGEGDAAPYMKKRMVVTPSAGYFHKSGLGIAAHALAVMEPSGQKPFQWSGTASYDYLQSRRLITGIAYTRFFPATDPGFYTSPLDHEAYAYFSYRGWWVKPALAASYGWGSRRSFETTREQLKKARLPESYTTTEILEEMNDFSVSASVRHDFYWLDVLANRDFIRLSPQVAMIAGTQKFGFNQTDNAYRLRKKTGNEIMYQSTSLIINDQSGFQPQFLTASLRAEWSKGIFFIQPNIALDYLFGATDKKLIPACSLNTGIIF